MPRTASGVRKPSILVLIFSFLLCASARAQTPYLVADGRPGEDPLWELVPQFPTPAGGLVFFWGESPSAGLEVWRSDGTAGGTFLLRDILPGPSTSDSNGSDDNEMAAVGDLLFFVAHGGSTFGGGELWRSDGTTAGTFQVSDIIPGFLGPEPVDLTPSGDLLFFSVQGAPALWRSDGTLQGTVRLDLGQDVAGTAGLADLDGTLLFFVHDTLDRIALWQSDGTDAGTVEVVAGPDSWQFVRRGAVVGDLLFFTVSTLAGEELWKSDGTAAGTVKVTSFAPDASPPEELTAAAGRLFFRFDDPAAGAELWASDGTAAGTGRVEDVQPGPGSSFPSSLTAVGGVLYFAADDGVAGRELWRSDGTAAGTLLVADLGPGPEGSRLVGLTAAGGRLFFSAVDAGLWVSDGTAAGTVRAGDVLVDSGSSFGELRLAAVGGVVYFSGVDGPFGNRELWRSDGTDAGTWPVDIAAGEGNHPAELTDFEGTLFFRAGDRFYNLCELWRSDGTAAGTVPVPDAASGEPVCPRQLTVAGGSLFFAAQSGSAGLWKTDGASAVQVAGAAAGLTQIGELEGTGSLLLFSACVAGVGCELWKSDGTDAGTRPVADLAPGPASSSLILLTALGGLVFFRAGDDAGATLWRSDGTAAGTFSLRDGLGRVRALTPFGGFLFFVVPSPVGDEVWRSDGTRAGTLRVFLGYGEGTIDALTVAGGSLFYFVRRFDQGIVDLWRGEIDRAERVTTFPPELNAEPEVLGAAAGLFFFSAGDAAGREPWVSDGTAAGTRRLADLDPGLGSSVPQTLPPFGSPPPLIAAFGRAVFAASDGLHGQEVWIFDGTVPFQLPEIAPGSSSSSPEGFTVSGGRVFFAADGGATGRELWAFTFDTPPAIVPGTSVQGAGWLATPRGKAHFQLRAREKKGGLDGAFRYRLPGVDLQSRSLSSLMVQGTTARLEGEGTLNGAGAYRFRLAVQDSRPDRLRLRIHNAVTGALVYDSEPGAPDGAPPATPLGGGSIQIVLPPGTS